MDSKYVQQFKKGSLEMILLCLIAKRETYGYEIITELNNNGASVLGYAKEGTVYPILYRLNRQNLLSAELLLPLQMAVQKNITLSLKREKKL